jgi:phage protein D
VNTSAVEAAYYVPAFVVEMNGKKLTHDVSKIISSITVTQVLNRTNSFRFVVQDEFRDGTFRWLGKEPFKYGNNVSIDLGYVGNMRRMTEGCIQNISASFFTGTAPTFTVEGADKAYKVLMERSEPKTFRKKKDSQIVEEIARTAHLKAVVDDTEQIHPVKEKKGGQSYHQFIKTLAGDNQGFEYRLSGRSLLFQKAPNDKEASVFLEWGRELISFRPSLNTAQAITEVVVRGWDGPKKTTIEARVPAGEERQQEKGKRSSSQIARDIYGDVVKVITDTPVRSVEEARRRALAELDRVGNNLVSGNGETVGISEIQPGVCIELARLGDWFSGKYYVERATHTLDGNGYRTTFEARRNAI